MEKNMEKYEAYKKMYDDLGKAMRSGFYYEAIFIEYAIFEDRLKSLLKYAGSPTERKGRALTLVQKLNIIRTDEKFSDKFVRTRLTSELLNALEDWKDKRNKLIHNLANTPYTSDEVKAIAETGHELLKVFKSKAQSVINYFQKNYMTE